MRLNGRANKKQLKANAKSVKARSASMNFWQTQYRANDKISRAQYKAITRIDRVRKWRMKKLKQSFNQALPQPMPQQGLPQQPVPGQPMPQPVNQPMPGQPVPGQPVPQQGLPQQPFPHSRSRASTFTGPGQPKYSKADVTKAMDQRKQQILEEAKKAKPTRTPTHSKGAR